MRIPSETQLKRPLHQLSRRPNKVLIATSADGEKPIYWKAARSTYIVATPQTSSSDDIASVFPPNILHLTTMLLALTTTITRLGFGWTDHSWWRHLQISVNNFLYLRTTVMLVHFGSRLYKVSTTLTEAT